MVFDAFIALFGDPCYIWTQCGIHFSTYLFIQTMLTLIVKFYETVSTKYNLEQYYSSQLYCPWFFKIFLRLTW